MVEIIEKEQKELPFSRKNPTAFAWKELISLGLKPSVNFKKILDDAYEAQLHGVKNP